MKTLFLLALPALCFAGCGETTTRTDCTASAEVSSFLCDDELECTVDSCVPSDDLSFSVCRHELLAAGTPCSVGTCTEDGICLAAGAVFTTSCVGGFPSQLTVRFDPPGPFVPGETVTLEATLEQMAISFDVDALGSPMVTVPADATIPLSIMAGGTGSIDMITRAQTFVAQSQGTDTRLLIADVATGTGEVMVDAGATELVVQLDELTMNINIMGGTGLEGNLEVVCSPSSNTVSLQVGATL